MPKFKYSTDVFSGSIRVNSISTGEKSECLLEDVPKLSKRLNGKENFISGDAKFPRPKIMEIISYIN